MATYCKNHVEEEVEKLEPVTKGKIERIPTKEGMCGHVGGCNTAHDDLYQLKYEYQPAEKDVEAAKETSDAAEKEKEAAAAKAKADAEKTEKTAAEEKPTEEAPTAS